MLDFHRYAKACIGLAFLVTLGHNVQSQQLSSYDSAYYKTYNKQVTGRFFFSKKYTGFTVGGPEGETNLRYKPNTFFSTGIGATYGVLTLNLGLGLGFLNPKREEKGKTTSIDLQSHIYTRKWVIDLYGQFYRGYYLPTRGQAVDDPDAYYRRRDMRVNLLGASVYRLMNGRQFSYRAAFLQNEWQKKSAGSLLIGGEVYTGVIKGDSALVPGKVSQGYPQRAVIKSSFTEFGPGVGYAYTAVYREHYFVTGSATVNADLGFIKEFTPTASENRTSFSPNFTLRAVAGYNSDVWSATFSWVNNNINLKSSYADVDYLVRTGNFRITLAKRFRPGRKLKKQLKIIDELPSPN